MVYRRRKGVAIVDTERGILVGAINGTFILPGGGANKWESRKKAAIRELYEETGLKTKKIKYLFRYKGSIWKNHRGKMVQNHSKVFLVEARGTPKPKSEIKRISFYKSGKKLKIGDDSREIIEKYIKKFKKRER